MRCRCWEPLTHTLPSSIWIVGNTAVCEVGRGRAAVLPVWVPRWGTRWSVWGTSGAGHLKGGAVRAAGQAGEGQLASSVRGRWNSAGTSGREQRKYWGRGGGQGGGQDPVVLTHSSDRQPNPWGGDTLGHLSRIYGGSSQSAWGEEDRSSPLASLS